MFISYKASLMSLLTVDDVSLPFTDWASFLNTDFKLIFHKFSKIYYHDLKNVSGAKRVLEQRTDERNLFFDLVNIILGGTKRNSFTS
jgi:hypothetical protein